MGGLDTARHGVTHARGALITKANELPTYPTEQGWKASKAEQ